MNKQIIDKLYPFFTLVIRSTYSSYLGKIIHLLLKNFKLLSGPMDQINNEIHQLPNWNCNLVNFAFSNLQNNLEHRKKIATLYAENISPKIISPKICDLINLSSNLRFPIFVNNRTALINYLAKNQIFVSDIWYDGPIAPKKYMSKTDYKIGDCPNAQLASEEILNLPTHQNISEKDAQNISQLINQWLKL